MIHYFLQHDGHRPYQREIELAKRQYRRENKPKQRWNNVLMIFSDVNYKRTWKFTEFVPGLMNAEEV